MKKSIGPVLLCLLTSLYVSQAHAKASTVICGLPRLEIQSHAISTHHEVVTGESQDSQEQSFKAKIAIGNNELSSSNPLTLILVQNAIAQNKEICLKQSSSESVSGARTTSTEFSVR